MRTIHAGAKPRTITEYISGAPEAARKNLRELRSILKKAAPKADEAIKWGSPVFETTRILFAFAAYRDHINFMPTPAVMDAFKAELAKHRTGKGTIQFPHDKPLPKALILRIARLRVRELEENDAKWM